MLKLNRAITLIFAMSNCSVFAGSIVPLYTPCATCEKPAFSFSADALYLQPSFGGNGLGYTSFSNYGNDIPGNIIDVNGATNHMRNINPDWRWGFELEGSYYLNPTNDFTLNWSRLNETTNGHLPQGTLFAGSAGGLYAGRLKVAPRWDAINLEVGQRFIFDECKTLRFHVGLAYAHIKTKFTNYPQIFPTGAPLFITKDSIAYEGFGPRFGGDFNYAIGYGVNLYAKAAGSLLVGTAKQSVHGYHDFVFAGNGFPYSTGNYKQHHDGVIVPELEAKLGVKYDCPLAFGNLGVDLGYLWITYLNAIVSQVGADVFSSAISASTTTNFDLNGVYFGIKWTGNFW